MSPEPPRRPRVAVVFGGRSAEHAVSCVTAGGVLRALDRRRWDVVPIGITRDGRWVLAADDPDRLAVTDGRLPSVDEAGGSVALLSDTGSAASLAVLEPGRVPRLLGEVDVVLPLLHGPYGEDGTLQGLLELAGVPYVGSGVLASAVGMDKHYMKVLLGAYGLPGCRYVVITDRQWRTDRAGSLARVERLGYPCFVKPARGGSSIGISRVDARQDLAAAVDGARQHDPKVLVEEAVTGRELECGVLEGLDGGEPDTSVAGEIRVSGHTFYDFEAKYLDEVAVGLDIPADVAAEVSDQVRALAVQCFDALGCEGLLRVDFFLRPDGSLLVNEVNTMPGFTPGSMFPRLWAASRLDYPALVDRLLSTALRRRPGLR